MTHHLMEDTINFLVVPLDRYIFLKIDYNPLMMSGKRMTPELWDTLARKVQFEKSRMIVAKDLNTLEEKYNEEIRLLDMESEYVEFLIDSAVDDMEKEEITKYLEGLEEKKKEIRKKKEELALQKEKFQYKDFQSKMKNLEIMESIMERFAPKTAQQDDKIANLERRIMELEAIAFGKQHTDKSVCVSDLDNSYHPVTKVAGIPCSNRKRNGTNGDIWYEDMMSYIGRIKSPIVVKKLEADIERKKKYIDELKEELANAENELAKLNMLREYDRKYLEWISKNEKILKEEISALNEMKNEMMGKIEKGELCEEKTENLPPVTLMNLRESKGKFTKRISFGNDRLDDLFNGGIPAESSILIIAPPFIGKELLMNKLAISGITHNIPVIIVNIDTSPPEIKKEIESIFPGLDTFENAGMLRFVDLYTPAIGMNVIYPHTTSIADITNQSQLLSIIEKSVCEMNASASTQILLFRSLSTYITYCSGLANTIKFIQSLVARLKIMSVLSVFSIDRGVHSEAEIQSLIHILDGAIELRVIDTKHFLNVQGITDVRSRNWIPYKLTKNDLIFGSFSLERIK
ncbi:MAG: ATPase domain-containing protein [Candidatus Thermoplasmatota archaeon]